MSSQVSTSGPQICVQQQQEDVLQFEKAIQYHLTVRQRVRKRVLFKVNNFINFVGSRLSQLEEDDPKSLLRTGIQGFILGGSVQKRLAFRETFDADLVFLSTLHNIQQMNLKDFKESRKEFLRTMAQISLTKFV